MKPKIRNLTRWNSLHPLEVVFAWACPKSEPYASFLVILFVSLPPFLSYSFSLALLFQILYKFSNFSFISFNFNTLLILPNFCLNMGTIEFIDGRIFIHRLCWFSLWFLRCFVVYSSFLFGFLCFVRVRSKEDEKRWDQEIYHIGNPSWNRKHFWLGNQSLVIRRVLHILSFLVKLGKYCLENILGCARRPQMMIWHRGVFLKIRGSLDGYFYWRGALLLVSACHHAPDQSNNSKQIEVVFPPSVGSLFFILLCIFMVPVRFVLIVVHSMLCSGRARDVSYGAATLWIGDRVCYVLES